MADFKFHGPTGRQLRAEALQWEATQIITALEGCTKIYWGPDQQPGRTELEDVAIISDETTLLKVKVKVVGQEWAALDRANNDNWKEALRQAGRVTSEEWDRYEWGLAATPFLEVNKDEL